MRSRAAVVAALIVTAALAAVVEGRAAAQSPFGDPNAEPAPFNPQMAALMSMLIQPRHAKLGLAGQSENWPLASYMVKELRQGFAVAAKAVPRWKGLPVPELFDAAVSQPITLLDIATKLQVTRQFKEAYGKLTDGCNACHATTDHAFVVIKVPEASAFPNMESSRSARASAAIRRLPCDQCVPSSPRCFAFAPGRRQPAKLSRSATARPIRRCGASLPCRCSWRSVKAISSAKVWISAWCRSRAAGSG